MPATLSPSKAFRYLLEERGCRLLASAVPRLSRAACLRLAAILGNAAYRLDRRGRRVALANLECAFVDRYTPSQRTEIARHSYRNFARTMLDLFWSRNVTRDNYRQYAHFEGFESLRLQRERHSSGAVYVSVHYGNFEWASLMGGYAGFNATGVAENFKNPRLAPIFKDLREKSGNRVIPQENSILRLLRVVKRGGAAEMLIDLTFRPSQATTVIEAFGMKMCVTLLPAMLAQRTGALIVPCEVAPLPDGTCRLTVQPPVEWPATATLQEIAQLCWNRFEPTIRARPEQWLWAYKHFRYKPRAAKRSYPFYANVSSQFEKLLRRELPATNPPDLPVSTPGSASPGGATGR